MKRNRLLDNAASRTVTLGLTPDPGILGPSVALTSTFDLDYTASTGENHTTNESRTQIATQAQLIEPS